MHVATEDIKKPSDSVWGRAHSSNGHETQDRDRRPGRLVAVSATGPIYHGLVDVTLVRVPVGLAFAQELAARAINPDARVVSSLANRVEGDAAMTAWSRTCMFMSTALVGASPPIRLQFLNEVMTYVRRQGDVNGIEPILGAVVNAAWPWMSHEAMERVLAVTSKYMRASEFAAANAVSVVDPNTGTFTVFAPGALAHLDLSEWLDWRALNEYEIGVGVPRRGIIGRNEYDKRAEDLTGIGKRPSLEGLQGADGLGVPAGPDKYDKRVADVTGFGRRPDLSNVGGNGGPYGYGSGLGAGGAAGWGDLVKGVGETLKWGGGLTVAAGSGLFVAGAAQGVTIVLAVTGGGTMIVGTDLIIGGTIAGAAGIQLSTYGDKLIREEVAARAKAEKEAEKKAAEKAAEEKAAEKEKEKTPEQKEADKKAEEKKAEEKKKGAEPKLGDLYPDPDGGGGGNPTMLPPDPDGGGGGNPTTLWDDNGGGGNPTTLWDENGGGGNPTTLGEIVTVPALVGGGLLADVRQVGPSTFTLP